MFPVGKTQVGASMQAWGRGRDVMAGDPVMERETELGIIQKGFFLGVKPAFCNSQ